MATTYEIVQALSQAAANAYDGALTEDGETLKAGLQREEGDPLIDQRVMDGFNVKFYGPMMCLSYMSEVRLKEVYANGVESDIESQMNEIVKFLRSFFNVRYLQEEGLDIPFTDTTVPLLGFNEPKDITEGELSVFEDEDVFGGSVIPFGLTRQRTLGDDEIDIDDLEQDPTISIEQEGNIDKGDTSEEEFYKRIGL